MGALEELAAQLGTTPDELRATLTGSDEALQPTYITVNPDGTVTATFSGHVVASGLDLNAYPLSAPAGPINVNKVQWFDPLGVTVGQLFTGYNAVGVDGILSLIGTSRDSVGVSRSARIDARARGGSSDILLTVIHDGDFQEKVLIRSDGFSDFAPIILTGCKALNTQQPFTILHNVNTPIPFDSEEFDTSQYHDDVTNNTRITVPTGLAGRYLCLGQGTIAAGANNQRQARLHVNGNLKAQTTSNDLGGSINVAMQVLGQFSLVAGDYVELVMYQNSGGPLDTVATNPLDLAALWLGS